MSVLNKYGLSFDSKKLNNPSALGGHLSGYLMGQSVEFISEDVLPEIDKAISGKPFDEDAGGFLSFLTIGTPTCTFSSVNEAEADCSIPTHDLKDILLLWVDWVNQHKIKTPGFSF
ncbi:hypothetical protein AAFN85_10000 [Mucilaginibacter sp. CAU 1740]|uniref:hypothetical protein n=1 Tax=Mucilaginibacter sp. CAU 1740 TaxID=3140365 RepID=UPI00325AED6C